MAGFMKKMFRGMETPAEEKKEAKALKSGKITPKQYVAGEKSEGHGAGAAKKAAAIKSGKVSPAKYAAEHKEKAMACGGKVKKMAAGGMGFGTAFGGSAGQKGAAIAEKARLAANPALAKKAAAATADMAKQKAVAAAAQPSIKPKSTAPAGNLGKVAKPVMGGFGFGMKKGGGVEAKGKTAGKTVKMAKGGSVDGCATKGKTRAKRG